MKVSSYFKKTTIESSANYQEVILFLGEIFPLIYFKNNVVYYDRSESATGKVNIL